MRIAFWRKSNRPRSGPPTTEVEKWLGWARIAALLGALALLLVSIVPVVLETAAPNQGGDINVKVEFYTAFEQGGGFITLDFGPTAANTLRTRIDTDHNGNVSDNEVLGYSQSIDAAISQGILVLRNFEMVGFRIDSQTGLAGEAIGSSAPAHVHFIFSGRWAQRDSDIVLGGDSVAELGYAGPLTTEVVHERTVIVNAGLASFYGAGGNSHALRVPAASIVTASGTWTNTSPTGSAGLPSAHFSLFSPFDSSLLLFVPMGVGLFVGVGGARREQLETGQRRVERFHGALVAFFLLLIGAYVAAVPGAVIWAGGIGLGVGGMLLAYRVYPADKRPDEGRFPTVAPKPPEPVAEEEQAAEGEWPKILVSAPPGERAAPAMVDALPAALLPQAPIAAEAPEPVPERAPRTPRAPPSTRPPAPQAPPTPAQAAAPAPAEPTTKRIRCPGCKTMFEAPATRPINVVCPHCGRRGVLR